MRWVQVAFVENDPGQYSLEFWLDYFRRIHADAACLSAGGCIAFYPTQVPYHYRSKFMGKTDPFGDFVKGQAWRLDFGRSGVVLQLGSFGWVT